MSSVKVLHDGVGVGVVVPAITIESVGSYMYMGFMRGSRRGATSITFFLLLFIVNEGREDTNTTISGPSSARQRNVI